MTKEILEILQADIYTDAPEYAARVAAVKQFLQTITFASEQQIERAREEYARGSSNNIEVDDEGARTSDAAPDGVWVQAWVWLDTEPKATCTKTWFVAGGRVERTCGEPAESACAECGEARCGEHEPLSFVEVDGRVLCDDCNV